MSWLARGWPFLLGLLVFLALHRLGLDDGLAVALTCFLGAAVVLIVAKIRGVDTGPEQPDAPDDQGRNDWRSSR